MLFSMCEKKICHENGLLNYTIQFLSEKLLLPFPPLPQHSCWKVIKRYNSSTSLNATFLNISGWRGCWSWSLDRQRAFFLYATGGSAHTVAHLAWLCGKLSLLLYKGTAHFILSRALSSLRVIRQISASEWGIRYGVRLVCHNPRGLNISYKHTRKGRRLH